MNRTETEAAISGCLPRRARRKLLPWRIVNPRCPQHGRGGDWGRVEAA